MTRFISVVVLLVCSSPFSNAQADPPLRLQILERTTVSNQFARILEGPFKCDSDASIFVSPYEGGGFSTNLVKIEEKGRRVRKFPSSFPPGFEKAMIGDYAIGRNNEVYMMVGNGKGDIFILGFDEDGKAGSTAKLEIKDMGPERLAVFDSGDFLVSGRIIEKQQLGKPFIAVFNDRGQFQRMITAKEDVKPGSPDVVALGKQEHDEAAGFAMALASMTERADDGSLYLARGTARGPIFVISPAGRIERTIKLTPPTTTARFAGFKVANGRVVAQFVENDPKGLEAATQTLLVLDSQSGKELLRYSDKNPEIGLAFACYHSPPDEFVFVGADNDGKMQLIRTSGPR